MTQEDRDSAMQEGSESPAEDENPRVKGPLRFLAFIFGLLVVVALVMAVAGSFLPREFEVETSIYLCLLYTSPSPRDQRGSGVAGWG